MSEVNIDSDDSNDLNNYFNNKNNIQFNIETLKYSVDFHKNSYKCEKLYIIYDKSSTSECIKSIRTAMSLFKKVDFLNSEIDTLNNREDNKTQKIEKIKLQKYILSISQDPCIQCILNNEFRDKNQIRIDVNNQTLFNDITDENLKLTMILKIFYFYVSKINETYGKKILQKLNLSDQNLIEDVKKKIIVDISAIFFQKCMEFAFLNSKEFEKYRESLQYEVNLFLRKNFGIQNNVDFNDKEVFNLRHIVALGKTNEKMIDGFISGVEIHCEVQGKESNKLSNYTILSSNKEPSKIQAIGDGFATKVLNFFTNPIKT